MKRLQFGLRLLLLLTALAAVTIAWRRAASVAAGFDLQEQITNVQLEIKFCEKIRRREIDKGQLVYAAQLDQTRARLQHELDGLTQ